MTCRCTQIYHDDSFVWELGAWAVVGSVAVALRLVVRFRVRGFKLQGDDYMAIVVLLCFCCNTGASLTTYYCGSTDYTGHDLKDFGLCEVDRITTTRKLQVSLKNFDCHT